MRTANGRGEHSTRFHALWGRRHGRAGLLAGLLGLLLVLMVPAGCSLEEDPAALEPPPPTTTMTVVAGDGKITLSWLPLPDAQYYHLYWSNYPGAGKTGALPPNVTSPYDHTRLTNSITYYYALTMGDSNGESDVIATANSTPNRASVPAPPGALEAVASNQQVTISWGATTGASTYNLYWSNTDGWGTSGNQILAVTSPYTHTG